MSINLGDYAWTPTLAKVGSHIQSRTRDVDTNLPLGTFTTATYPTAAQVTVVIGTAVATVSAFVGTPLMPVAENLCEAVAALWSAYWVELTFPERDGNVSVYSQLRADALLLMEQAKAVNLGAGGGTTDPPDEDGQPDRLSSYYFPEAPREYVL